MLTAFAHFESQLVKNGCHPERSEGSLHHQWRLETRPELRSAGRYEARYVRDWQRQLKIMAIMSVPEKAASEGK